ncbi:M56 family metallopeptidase [Rhodanobacter sp. DHB23]|uniref:M56 family metallopeptidase n=1 Tax=Rhodanobacter sp. DHB23 TaxID=2775923 RepID=UPI001783601A|nr:M56 family metallopeptidase [Rhodanobacter sp. DHB23]MBD8874404.1 M56 family metallopeptidase [Rhodanobacter sp. DHB23]
MTTLDHLASTLLERLAWTSLQAAVLVVAVALLIRALPRLPAAARCALWWLVGLQVVLGLCWQAPIRLPLLAPPAVAEAPIAVVQTATDIDHAAVHRMAVHITMPTAAGTSRDTPPGWLSSHWRTTLIGAWLLLLLAQLPALLRAYRIARRLRRNASATTDAGLQMRCARQAHTLGLRRAPSVLASPEIASPQVSGGWRPVVLWPARDALDEDEAALALAHELAHLKRGDLLFGWVPALAARLFFFHPLLRWAMREYAINREAACDALAVEQQRVAPQDYGRLLLRLGVAHPTHAALAGASPTFHNLKRRLTMLQQTTTAMPRARGWLLVALVALVGVLPYRVVAGDQAARAAVPAPTSSIALPPPPPAPPAQMPDAPPPPRIAPPPPPPPPLPVPPAGFGAHNVEIDIHSDAREGLALFDGDTVIINGTTTDEAAAKRIRVKSDEPLLWLRRGGQAYVVHDRAMIQRARDMPAPLEDYWRNAGSFEGKQWSIKGPMQGLQAWQDSVQAQREKLLATPDAPESRQRLADLDQQQQQITVRLADLKHELGALQPQIEAMQKQRQTAESEVERRKSALIDDALAKGLAKPVNVH